MLFVEGVPCDVCELKGQPLKHHTAAKDPMKITKCSMKVGAIVSWAVSSSTAALRVIVCISLKVLESHLKKALHVQTLGGLRHAVVHDPKRRSHGLSRGGEGEMTVDSYASPR